MKRRGKTFALVLILVCTSMLFTLSASASNGKKRYKIKVSDIKVSSTNLKLGDKCRISMKIENEGYEKLKKVGLVYSSPTTQYYQLYLKYNKSSQKWIGSFKVEKGMQKGIWRIWSIFANRDPNEDGFTFYNNYFSAGKYPGKSSNLSKGNICVRKTKGDYSKPNIDFDTLSVSKSAITEQGAKITYRLKVTDKSNIALVRLTICEPVLEGQLLSDTEIKLKFNKKTGYYETTIWKPKGTYILGDIYVRDVFGNSGTYFNKECDKYYPHRETYHSRLDLSRFRVDIA